ncbi:aminotransferase class I/II-fold pyridoxal phosphate-dependent enzyme [Oceanobacillus saliphilus]|uniref:aminotransferase class I/II-fold pyridoxal phosphate-dependent enzyme n=1 Tax=Oceanobacillus saliphilus TaxID=2925834 RepID=UPI00201D4DFE|nr:aminotransferase class I/II-fold pyridoxal phosphate-dependent enzyme [Oceanobacillus saliphilus]
MFVSKRVQNMPKYVFSEFQRRKKELQEKGVDVIDLGIGAPDLPTPSFICDVLTKEVGKPENHRYSNYSGDLEFREAVAHFYLNHYGVSLDPETEVLTLIGSKEGIAHLIQAVINPGDKVIIPDPGYPVYRMGSHIAGAVSVPLTLDAGNGYRPDYKKLSPRDINDTKLMFLNYPSNPTTATISTDTFEKAISFVRENKIMLAHDAAYDLVTFNGYTSPSVLQVPHAKEYAVEFGSLSKSFNMTGWRIGYVVGNQDVIGALKILKSNVDTSQFLPIQKAAAAALRSDFQAVCENNDVFYKRMKKLHHALNNMGITVEEPKGTIFLWAKVPQGFTSDTFVEMLLTEAGIMVTPGTAFGKQGEGYIRISLSVTEKVIDEVIRRLGKLNLRGDS